MGRFKIVFPLDPHYKPTAFDTVKERDEAWKQLSVSDWRKAYKQDDDGPYYS